ncbi:MAG: chemotaxis protein CheB [Steroidobacteraceae bacterium]
MSSAATRVAQLRPGHDFDVLVIGGSAGAFTALRTILPALAHPAIVGIVLVHQAPHGGDLAELFIGHTALPCLTVEDKLPATPGAIYFAPAGYHLLVERDGHFALSVDAPVNYSRPSIDVLFESVAAAYGTRAAGLVLTGANDDGANGLRSIVESGGIALVQDPKDAEVPMMPKSALRMVTPDAVLTLDQITELFAAWSRNVELRA